MAKLSRKPRAARDAVSSVIVVAGSSTSDEPSSAYAKPPPPSSNRASLTKRKHEATAQLPNKRPRLKNPAMGFAITESDEEADVNPDVLDVMNRFKVNTRVTRSSSRAETPKIEVRLRSSKGMGDRYAIPPGKRAKPAPPVESPIPEDEDQGEPREGESQPETSPEPEEDQEGEQMEYGNQSEAEADNEVEQPEDDLFVKKTQPSPPVLKRRLNPRSNRERNSDKVHDGTEDEEESNQVLRNPSSPLQPKQTLWPPSSNPSSTTQQRRQTINNLQVPPQAPQVRRNVTRLPSKPWINDDDDDFGYPDGATRTKKNNTAGGTSQRAPSRLEKASRPPVAPARAPAPPTRVQQTAAASRARSSPMLEPARQRRPAPSPRGDRSPLQVARIRPSSIFGSDSAGESDSADETDEDADPMPDQPTVPMSCSAVLAMHKIMGRAGWTNRKTKWARRLAADGTEPEHDAPGTTNLGRQMFKYLITLKRALNKIPKMPYFAKQARYIAAHGPELKRMFFETNKLLTKIREEDLAPIGESDRRANGDLSRRRGMVHDVLHYLMPMLVHVVWTAFSLGGLENDAEGGGPTLAEEGTFTDVTLGYIVKVSHWIRNLMDALEVELRERPFEDDDAAGKKDKDRSRASFRDALDNWFMEFEEAQEAVDDLATGAARRAWQLEEDERIKEARMREVERQEAETERKWRQMAAYTQYIASQPNPLQVKWQRATDLSQRPPESMYSGSSGRTWSSWSWEPPAPIVQNRPWCDEDRAWLLHELRNVRGVFKRDNGKPSEKEVKWFADSLSIPVEEVKWMMEVLRRDFRRLCMEKGFPLEPFAQ